MAAASTSDPSASDPTSLLQSGDLTPIRSFLSTYGDLSKISLSDDDLEQLGISFTSSNPHLTSGQIRNLIVAVQNPSYSLKLTNPMLQFLKELTKSELNGYQLLMSKTVTYYTDILNSPATYISEPIRQNLIALATNGNIVWNLNACGRERLWNITGVFSIPFQLVTSTYYMFPNNEILPTNPLWDATHDPYADNSSSPSVKSPSKAWDLTDFDRKDDPYESLEHALHALCQLSTQIMHRDFKSARPDDLHRTTSLCNQLGYSFPVIFNPPDNITSALQWGEQLDVLSNLVIFPYPHAWTDETTWEKIPIESAKKLFPILKRQISPLATRSAEIQRLTMFHSSEGFVGMPDLSNVKQLALVLYNAHSVPWDTIPTMPQVTDLYLDLSRTQGIRDMFAWIQSSLLKTVQRLFIHGTLPTTKGRDYSSIFYELVDAMAKRGTLKEVWYAANSAPWIEPLLKEIKHFFIFRKNTEYYDTPTLRASTIDRYLYDPYATQQVSIQRLFDCPHRRNEVWIHEMTDKFIESLAWKQPLLDLVGTRKFYAYTTATMLRRIVDKYNIRVLTLLDTYQSIEDLKLVAEALFLDKTLVTEASSTEASTMSSKPTTTETPLHLLVLDDAEMVEQLQIVYGDTRVMSLDVWNQLHGHST